MMKLWISRILIVFSIFTLGYGLGKNAAIKRVDSSAAGVQDAGLADKTDKVVIYYLHTTFRCVTCNAIERIARETVEREFGDLLENGKAEWRAVNFQMNEALAKRYEVASSSLVIVKIKDGWEVAFRRLDEAWTIYDKPDEFSALITGVVKGYLEELEI